MALPEKNIKNYFSKHNEISSRCKLCLTIIKHHNNTTNLRNHMKRKHCDFFQSSDEKQKQLKLISSTTEGDADTDASTITLCSPSTSSSVSTLESHDSCSSNDVDVHSESHSTNHKQRSISTAFQEIHSFAEGGKTYNRITNALLYMIVVDNLPLSTTEQRGFKYFRKVSLPLYKAPSRNTVTRQLDEKYDVLSKKFKLELAAVETFTLTTDIWTDSLNNKGYLGLTVHYLDNNILKSMTIGVYLLEQRHTADYIGQTLISGCQEWSISPEKVMAVVTDNAANMVKAVHDFFNPRKHLPCIAHTLNLIVTNALKDYKEIITTVKSIVTFFKTSGDAGNKLRQHQLQNGKTESTCLKLIQDCETRWNSTYYMIKRFLDLAPIVSAILYNYPKVKMVSHAEIQILREIVQIFAPFEQITTEMSGEQYITCSKIIPLTHCLKLTLERMIIETETGKSILKKLQNDITKRFYSDESSVEKNSLLAVSTIIDPRFKRIHFESPAAVANALNKIKTLVEGSSKNTSQTSNQASNNNTCTQEEPKRNANDPWSIHEMLIPKNQAEAGGSNSGGLPVEIKHYLDQPVISRLEDPLKYWLQSKLLYPNLYKIAVSYLPIVGTSVPCERLFSKAGTILTDRRNRLTGKRLSARIFLSSLSEEQWHLE